jgi:hypothetical protein
MSQSGKISLGRCQRLGRCGFAPNCICDTDPRDDGPFVNTAEAGGITPADREQPQEILTARDLS